MSLPLRIRWPSRRLQQSVRHGQLWMLVASIYGHSVSGAEPGIPPNAGKDPGAQAEAEWADNRWQQTDVGPWLGSVLDLPGDKIARGLSVKVGESGDAVMAYDKGTVAFRAAWTGGFLSVDKARYGLARAPKPQGTLVVSGTSNAGWTGGKTRFIALHRTARSSGAIQPVLEFQVGDRHLREAPTLVRHKGNRWFVRTIHAGPGTTPIEVALPVTGAGNEPVDAPRSIPGTGSHVLQFRTGDSWLVAAVRGMPAKMTVRHEGNQVWWTIPADNVASQFEIWFTRVTANADAATPPGSAEVPWMESLARLESPRNEQWPMLVTRGDRGLETGPLAVDTLTAPYDNPFKALLFFAGVDFARDGTAFACTIHGDVWRIRGVDAGLARLEWKRMATGLHQPLGLKVRNDQVYVLGHDEITRLIDSNNDGEADHYESFFNQIQTSAGGHDYVTCLESDSDGNFYYVDPKGVHRVDPTGATVATLATGWRNPNGMGVSPDGRIVTVSPQQGDWTPSSLISEVRAGGYYGYPGPKVLPGRPTGYDPHLCWIPHRIDNSSGSQVWVPQGSWGPLGGHCLHLLWGRCGMMGVLRDEYEGGSQGAVFPLPVRFLAGPNRGSFNSRDGHLYLAGSTGWQTSALRDGAIQRIRRTERPLVVPVAWQARAGRLEVTFSEPMDATTATDVGSHSLTRWNYRYAQQYGSKDWSVTNPDREGRDPVSVERVELLENGRRLRLVVPGLEPVMQMEWKYSLDTATKRAVSGQLWLTINRLPQE